MISIRLIAAHLYWGAGLHRFTAATLCNLTCDRPHQLVMAQQTLVRITRSEKLRTGFYLERRSANGSWSRRMPLKGQFRNELAGLLADVGDGQIELIWQGLRDMKPGETLIFTASLKIG